MPKVLDDALSLKDFCESLVGSLYRLSKRVANANLRAQKTDGDEARIRQNHLDYAEALLDLARVALERAARRYP